MPSCRCPSPRPTGPCEWTGQPGGPSSVLGWGGGLQTGSSWRWVLAKVAEGMRSLCRARQDWKNWGLQCEARGQGRLQGRQAPTQAWAGSSRREAGVGPAQGWEPRPTLGVTKLSQTTLPGAGSAPALLQRPWGRELPESEVHRFHTHPPTPPPVQWRGSSSDLRGVHLCGIHSGSGCLGRKGRKDRRGAGPRALRLGLAAVSCPLTSMRIL